MRIFDITILGWIHTAACLIALPTGLFVLAMAKGTRQHRKIGLWYFYAMVAANLTALGLYRGVPGLPTFNMFHWMAVSTLFALAVAYVGARRQRRVLWAYAHPAGMIYSYYMLTGGLINEVFSRTDAFLPFRGPAQGMTQGVNMLLFAAVLIVALVRVSKQRGRLKAAAT